MFACDTCNKSFNRRENLVRHEKIHNTAPAFVCSTCGKGFSRSDVARRHEALIHDASSATPESVTQGSKKRRRVIRTEREPSNHDQSISTRFNVLRSGTNIAPAGTPEAAQTEAVPNETVTMRDAAQGSLQDLWSSMIIEDIDIDKVINEDWLFQDLSPSVDVSAWTDFGVLPAADNNSNGPRPWTERDTRLSEQMHCARQPFQPTTDNEGEAGSNVLPSDPAVLRRAAFVPNPALPDPSDARARMASPLDETTNLDHIPYAWKAGSGRPQGDVFIEFDPEDQLFAAHDKGHDISAETLQQLESDHSHLLERTHTTQLQMPSLRVVNVLIALFYQHFYPQAPAIHKTVHKEEILRRPYLLTAMIAIGATYSGRKGGRRLAVHLVEQSRRCFQAALEEDNKLMRDPLTIYAGYLICFTGLWCGNKRAFELAEAFRGQLVTYVRRIQAHLPNIPTGAADPDTHWRHWIEIETQRRICWLIYYLDSQFPALLHIPPMMSVTETLEWLCPCDDEFWLAPSARFWKSTLGPALIPPAKLFSAAFLPIINADSDLPLLRLNAWSRLLVITTISVHVFNFAQDREMRTAYQELFDNKPESSGDAMMYEKLSLALRRCQLDLQLPADHLSHIADTVHEMAYFHLHVSIKDLQDVIGKSGEARQEQAKGRLRTSIAAQPPTSPSTLHMIEAFGRYAEDKYHAKGPTNPHAGTTCAHDLTPYSAVAFFLTCLYFYAYSLVATESQRETFRDHINVLMQKGEQSTAYDVLRCGFDPRPDPDAAPTPGNISAEPAKLFLRYGASRLLDYGGWGCSIGLGLLLHWRSKL
ncbi:fungal-specific transcription factor domain-containing protein [Elsinoe ampelina]|uniref:pH-response transcription factor pacC/RIM101 n=1 Tax=Elsinoe ampelina TaxID=302913 RepID=A0A6A6GAI4_9PEZI|nr:fungal-specific transcription factor domain-containing protein [Elsinoe ampelina]